MAAPREPIVPEGVRRTGGSDRAQRGADDARDTADRAKEELKDAGRELKDSAREATARVRIEAREAADEVKEAAEDQVEAQKTRTAGKAHAIARALREAGEVLDREGEADLARYGRDGAEQVERMASYLDRNDMNGLIADLEGTARRNPGAFVGTTFAAGMLLGRFLRSSSPRTDDHDTSFDADDDDLPGSTPITTAPAAAATRPAGPATHAGGAADRSTPSDPMTTRYAASPPRSETTPGEPGRSRGSTTGGAR